MPNIFKIIPGSKESNDFLHSCSLGIKMKIGKIETICPVTEFISYGELESEIDSIKNELTDIQKKLKSFKNGNTDQGAFGINDDASPEEIWEVLSTVTDNSSFIEIFNSLSEFKRRELADHVFGNCNMFTGKGAFFSAYYVQETALLTV